MAPKSRRSRSVSQSNLMFFFGNLEGGYDAFSTGKLVTVCDKSVTPERKLYMKGHSEQFVYYTTFVLNVSDKIASDLSALVDPITLRVIVLGDESSSSYLSYATIGANPSYVLTPNNLTPKKKIESDRHDRLFRDFKTLVRAYLDNLDVSIT